MLNAMQPKHANKLMQNEYANKQYAIGIQPNMQTCNLAYTMLWTIWHTQCYMNYGMLNATNHLAYSMQGVT